YVAGRAHRLAALICAPSRIEISQEPLFNVALGAVGDVRAVTFFLAPRFLLDDGRAPFVIARRKIAATLDEKPLIFRPVAAPRNVLADERARAMPHAADQAVAKVPDMRPALWIVAVLECVFGPGLFLLALAVDHREA